MNERPQWEDCKVCGGDHWTKDHPSGTTRVPRQVSESGVTDETRAAQDAYDASLPDDNGMPQLRLRPVGDRPLFPGDPNYPARSAADPTEPRTQAGKRLLRMLEEEWFLAPKMELGSDWYGAILAIEAEVRADIARQVARLPNPYDAKTADEAHDEAYLMAAAVGYDFALKDAARLALQAADPLEPEEAP